MGVSVTVETVAHGQGHDLRDNRHLADLSMTVCTIDSGRDMRLVREVDKIGKTMDPFPGERLPVRPVLTQALDIRLFYGGHAVAVHANRQGGNARVATDLDSGMAVVAVNPHTARM